MGKIYLKKAIVLSLFALIASSCGQTTKKQTETISETNSENINIGQYSGV